MSATLRFVLGDQLSRDISSLRDLAEGDVVLIAEVGDEATYVRHHQRKIAFLFSAMRHFADGLRRDGIGIDYVALDDPENSASFTGELGRALERHPHIDRIVVTEPGEWRVAEMIEDWASFFGRPVEIRPDDRFLCTRAEFAAHAGDRRSLRMEDFYREMRRRTGYLMEGDKPTGGRWNWDAENRAPLPRDVGVPERPRFEPDETTQAVLRLVASRFGNHFGSLRDFDYPVTREDALLYLDWFATEALPRFGTYQDAMRQGEPLLFHSHLSALINCGLLTPRETCERALAVFAAGGAPINAVEGFVRQIIGWREFVRGVYWREMPGYATRNALHATRPLPDFFWTGETELNCLAQSIGDTARNAYAHHIQRLMVLGNFCLLAGIDPAEVQEWYLVVYHDAYEWVEMPNVVGMILHADGGLLATKPYAASGNYINRMSDYCRHCRYDVRQREGEDACPFNYLYWDFVARHAERLAGNHRTSRTVSALQRLDPARLAMMRGDALRFLDALPPAAAY